MTRRIERLAVATLIAVLLASTALTHWSIVRAGPQGGGEQGEGPRG